VGGCVVISDKAQRMRKWALSWARYRRRDTITPQAGRFRPFKPVLELWRFYEPYPRPFMLLFAGAFVSLEVIDFRRRFRSF